MNYKSFVFIKLILLFIALALASFLAFGESGKNAAPDQQVVFVLDINRTMNTKDIFSGNQKISRLQAAKSLIRQYILSDDQSSYGLILFNASADYIIPPTFDTGTFLLYLSGITTNLLPDGVKDFAQLTGLLRDTSTFYLLLSDFDAPQQRSIQLPRGTTLLGLGSLAGDTIRYSNGVAYYDNGKSTFSARNDRFAQSLGVPYTSLSQMGDVSLGALLSHGFTLPMSQRIVLYMVLGVLIVFVVFL